MSSGQKSSPLFTHPLPNRRHHILKVREDVSVGLMAMRGNELAVDADVELAVVAGNQLESLDVRSHAIQCFSRHPGGTRCVASVVAVLDLDVQLISSHHQPPGLAIHLMIGRVCSRVNVGVMIPHIVCHNWAIVMSTYRNLYTQVYDLDKPAVPAEALKFYLSRLTSQGPARR